LGRFFYKIKRFWRNLTADIRRELELEEMREEMQRYREELKKLQEQIKRDTTQIDKGLTSLSDLTDVGQGRPFNLK
jgi:sec-independent protein translocase protein TatB